VPQSVRKNDRIFQLKQSLRFNRTKALFVCIKGSAGQKRSICFIIPSGEHPQREKTVSGSTFEVRNRPQSSTHHNASCKPYAKGLPLPKILNKPK
ncbi:hypothetical protein, partial [Bacteroides caccae]|uniref:hypothetical protein n=2 Tax=Bacteroides caccae TaxID=47678 RepID=UPI0034A14BD3